MSELNPLIQKIIEVAKEYRKAYQRPLGSITGDIGEHIIAHQFKLNLAGHQEAGYDATSGNGRRIQIKSRIFSNPPSDRVGKVNSENYDDLLVASFDIDFNLLDVYWVESKILESHSPFGSGKNERNPTLNLIRRIGKSLKKTDGSWLSI